MKRPLLSVIFLLSAVCAVWALPFQGTVISPVAGTWENTQPLIIQTTPGIEVYYSLSGSDPLVSGFAYDGPIMLEGTGEQKLTLVSVSDEGISDIHTVNFTSNGRQSPSYIPLTTRDVYIRITEKTHIELPDSVRWAAGVSANQTAPEQSAFCSGGELSLNGRCDEPRIIPLILSTAQGFYRYIIRAGIEPASQQLPVPEYEGIEFANWNYIRFNSGRSSLYSIDGSPWQQTTKPVFIDRTTDHTVSWKELKPVTPAELDAGFDISEAGDGTETAGSDGTQTMLVPAKPSFELPDKSWTSGSVEITFPSDDYILAYEDRNGHIHYQSAWSMALVQGDSEGVSEHFTIYYKGIKQGTQDISVLINRRIPAGPELVSSVEGSFSRSEVSLTFKSADTVYYKVSVLEKRPYGFDFATDDIPSLSEAEQLSESAGYAMLQEGTIVLGINPDAAVLYKISAWSQDVSGNRSNLTQYTVVVDGANLYVADDASSFGAQFVRDAPYGSMNNPCHSIAEAVKLAEEGDFINPRIFVAGTHVLDSTLVLSGNIRLEGRRNARIRLTEKACIEMNGGTVSLSGITLEKKETQSSDDGRKCLISMKDTTLSLYDCELYADFVSNGIAIVAENGVLNIKKCGITACSETYTALASSQNTRIFIYNVRGIANAPTAVGISAEGGVCYLADSAFSVIGSLGRVAEYVNLQWVLEACSLSGINSLPVESAVWTDKTSVLLSDKANTYSGFSRLWVKAEE